VAAAVDGNTWSYTFQALPVYSEDLTAAYSYTVAEYQTPEGYASSATDTTVINKAVGTVDIELTKLWVAPAGTQFPEITLSLTGSDGSSYTISANSEGAYLDGASMPFSGTKTTWSFTAKDLPAFESDTGAAITYTLSETPVDGYTTQTVEDLPFTLVNVIEQNSDISVSAQKLWVGMDTAGHYEPSYPDTITVALYCDGVLVKGSKQTVPNVGDEFPIQPYTGLDQYDLTTGKEHVYQVLELNDDGNPVDAGGIVSFGKNNNYVVSYRTDEDGVQTITNTYQAPAAYLYLVTTHYVHRDYDGSVISDYTLQTPVFSENESKTVSVSPSQYTRCSEDGLVYDYDRSASNVTSVELVIENRLYNLELYYVLTEQPPELEEPGNSTTPDATPAPNPGSGSSTPSNPSTNQPTVSTPSDDDSSDVNVPSNDTTVDIPDDDTPLGSLPDEDVSFEELPDEDVPLGQLPNEDLIFEELPDEDVPLGQLPEEDSPLEELPDEDVPLADVPATGDSLPIWGLAAILSGAALIPLTLLGKKRREDEV
jgi:hypothetical protein